MQTEKYIVAGGFPLATTINRLEEGVIFKEFSECANKLLGRTVWIINDDGRVERKWICKINIWKMMSLWEEDMLFFTVEEAEEKLSGLKRRLEE